MVEHEPSKLVTWVRFPSPAPDLGLAVRGRFFALWQGAGIAQLVEHLHGKPITCPFFWKQKNESRITVKDRSLVKTVANINWLERLTREAKSYKK